MPSKYLLSSLVLLLSSLGFVDANVIYKKANYQHYVINGTHTGINTSPGVKPPRRNILDTYKDSVTWSLYMQGLTAMQSTAESTLTSWYQIAGIHGRPYAPWDNVPQTPGAPLTGYCTHSSVLFPTWHRPYLAMYEQIIAGHIQTIAKTYPAASRSLYQTAADNFRIPYWDWASIPQMPDCVNTVTVTITAPSGLVQTIKNPLLQYKFLQYPLNPAYFPTNPSQAYDYYLAKYNVTVRNPDSLGAGSDYKAANNVLANDNLKSRTYYALTKATSYDNFASQALWGPSIENVHGSVHVDVGGNLGHMSQLSYAGFDPIFWLHHANVDRIITLWQAMNPSSLSPSNYLTPSTEYAGTFTLLQNSIDNINTPLAPFSTNTQGTFWTSANSQYCTTFGYTYPEIPDWGKTPAQLASSVTAQVNTLYGPASSKKKRTTPATGSQVKEWSVAISASKNGLNGLRFLVRLFLGEPPANPLDWSTSTVCVGSFAVFPSPNIGAGAPDVVVYDEISLVKGLARIGLDGQNVDDTVKFLKGEGGLSWKVQLFDGTVVPTEQLSSLKVMVQEEDVILGKDIYELPKYGEKTLHPEITAGKAGG